MSHGNGEKHSYSAERDDRLAIDRRAVLGRIAAAGTLMLFGSRTPRADPPRIPHVPPPAIRFDVMRSGEVIGGHTVTFKNDGDGLTVRTHIDIAVRLLGVKVFEFRHDGTERWQNGRLQAFDSKTIDDDSEFFVTGRATSDGFEVKSKKGVEKAPAEIMVGSYWTPAIAQQTLLIDPQRGRLKAQQLLSKDTLTVPVAGTPVAATRYRLLGITDGWVAYDDKGRWLAAELKKKGSDILYRLPG